MRLTESEILLDKELKPPNFALGVHADGACEENILHDVRRLIRRLYST